MSYDGAGALFALGVRLTKLDVTGAPQSGAGKCYVTDALVRIGFGQTYSEPDAVDSKNGRGQTCVYYAPAATLLGGTVEEFRLCTPDPYVLEFCSGGEIITSGGTNEVQTVTITGTPTGGTFTLTFNGQTTAAIAYNAIASAVQSALIALSNINTGDVTVGGGPGPGTPYTVTFAGQYASTNVSTMAATGSFTGGTSPAVAVTTTTQGAPGTTVTGYRAPQVNVEPTPYGIGIEAWCNAIINGAVDSTRPYMQWVIPRAFLRPTESYALGAGDPTQPVFAGTNNQNPNFGAGPVGDITFPTDRVYQWNRVSSLPDFSAGLVTVS